LLSQPFDPKTRRLTGEPRLVANNTRTAVSGGRTLIHTSSIPVRQLKWLDRTGKEVGALGEPNVYVLSRISADGRRVATTRAGPNADLWVMDTARGLETRLTPGRGIHGFPVWSPDGRTILFDFGAPFNIFRIGADGGGVEERVTQHDIGVSVNVYTQSTYTQSTLDSKLELVNRLERSLKAPVVN
jgi:hypothetical protein